MQNAECRIKRRNRPRVCILSSAFIVLHCLLLSGCVPPRPQNTRAYFGPTEPMTQVIAAINANSGKIPSIWALLTYRADLFDEQHHAHSISGDGSLLFRRPQSLLLRGDEALAGEVFAIGSNDSEFWLKVAGDVSTTWWGHYANLGKPCCRPVPIRPDMVLEVLGVSLFDVDLLRQPAPVMRFNNDTDAYMFDWIVRGRDRWLVQKEIWYDRQTKLPELVLLFDDDGRVVLRAQLSRDVPLATPGVPRSSWPMIARQYDLLFPADGSRISFSFTDDLATSHHNIPRPSSFRRPTEPGTRHVEQVDAACAGGEQ